MRYKPVRQSRTGLQFPQKGIALLRKGNADKTHSRGTLRILAARHSTFTVTAADESLERMVMLLARGIPPSTSNDLLSKRKVFLADNNLTSQVGAFAAAFLCCTFFATCCLP